MKALEKDRTRRYETASALASDIQRYLNNEPVAARPPSNVYRFQKLVRRNKTAFAAVGAVATALVIGLGLSLYLFAREREAHHRAVAAEREQARLRQQAEASLALEAEMRRILEGGKKYGEAGLRLAQRQWDEAERIVSDAPPHPAAASIFSVLGMIHAIREQWPAAVTNYAKVVALIPDDPAAYHWLAALLVQTGDIEGYRRHCAEIVRRFAGTTNVTIAERSVKDCLILPASAELDLSAVAKMAETALAAGPDHKHWAYFQLAKGLAEYRQGRFASAAEWLQKVAALKGDVYRTVQAHMLLAMTEFQLNHSDGAHAIFAKGFDIAKERFPKPGSGLPDEQWHDWIFAHALIREAKALIASVSSAPAGTAQNIGRDAR